MLPAFLATHRAISSIEVDIIFEKMRLLKIITVLTITVSALLSGCADNREFNLERANKLKQTAPHCYSDQECNEKWSAAQKWITKNCPMEILLISDTVIKTAKSPRNSSSLSVTVSKEPLGKGRYQLIIWAGCDNVAGCLPDAFTSALNFNDYINSIGSQ